MLLQGVKSSPRTLAGVQSPPRAQAEHPAQRYLLLGVPMPPSPRWGLAGTILIQEPPGTGHWGWQGHVPCTWVLPCVDTRTRKLCPMGWAGTGIPLPGCAAPHGSPSFPRGYRERWLWQGRVTAPRREHSPLHTESGDRAKLELRGCGSSSAPCTAMGCGCSLEAELSQDRHPRDRHPPASISRDRHPRDSWPGGPPLQGEKCGCCGDPRLLLVYETKHQPLRDRDWLLLAGTARAGTAGYEGRQWGDSHSTSFPTRPRCPGSGSGRSGPCGEPSASFTELPAPPGAPARLGTARLGTAGLGGVRYPPAPLRPVPPRCPSGRAGSPGAGAGGGGAGAEPSHR